MLRLLIHDLRSFLFCFPFQEINDFFDDVNAPDNQPEPEFQSAAIATCGEYVWREIHEKRGCRRSFLFSGGGKGYLMEEVVVPGLAMDSLILVSAMTF